MTVMQLWSVDQEELGWEVNSFFAVCRVVGLSKNNKKRKKKKQLFKNFFFELGPWAGPMPGACVDTRDELGPQGACLLLGLAGTTVLQSLWNKNA